MTRFLPARSVALLLAMTLIVAACGSTAETASPTPTPSPAPTATAEPSPSGAAGSPSAAPSGSPIPDAEAAAIYDAIEDQVLAIRGLAPTTVERQTIDAETLKAMTRESFDQDNPAEYVAASDRLLKALGLIDEDASLKELYLDLLGSSVAGFYRPEEKTLYVVSRTGRISGSDKITFAHEYDHALQDANFPGVFAEQRDLLDRSDQALARAALYEGDATLLMSLWAVPNLSPEDLQDVLAAGADPESAEVLARTPAFLTEGLLFPYNQGLTFVAPIQTAGGWAAVDDVWADLPLSTEQILHPEKYESGEAPVDVALPDDLAARLGDGWTVPMQDTFGEFQTRTWLRESEVATAAADDAAAGWGGDRLAVLDGPGGSWAVAWRTTWDTDADADEFTDAAGTAIEGLPHPARISAPGGRDVTILIGSDDEVLLSLDKVFGATGV